RCACRFSPPSVAAAGARAGPVAGLRVLGRAAELPFLLARPAALNSFSLQDPHYWLPVVARASVRGAASS
ncbi:hypothetical protein, partial [Escherichia coli]